MATTTYPGLPADFKSRHKPSTALVERHSTTAQYNGGSSFKAKSAAAKRAATTLRKTADELYETVSATDLEALSYERAGGELMAIIGRDIFDDYVAHRRAELGGKK